MALPLVALSGEEAVAALRRFGFHVRTEAGTMILSRGARRVVVPTERILEVDTVRRILRDAGVDYVALLDSLPPSAPVPSDGMKGDS